MTALIGTFVSLKTMADLTPRIVLDMQCTLAELAALGIEAGTPFALARLNPCAANAALAPQTEPEPEPPKGGALSKWAALRGGEAHFQEWLSQHYNVKIRNATDAAAFIRHECDVESRAELDNDPRASRAFDNLFRLPYSAYCQGKTR
jgi:hypothetical protein